MSTPADHYVKLCIVQGEATIPNPGTPDLLVHQEAPVDVTPLVGFGPDDIDEIWMMGNGITDDVLAKIAPRLKPFRFLALYQTSVTGSGIAHLIPLTNLQSLSLNHEHLGDDALPHVGKMIGLKQLEIYDTSVTDAGLKQLRNLPQLEYMDLALTKITDEGLAALKPLTSLKRLNLSGDKITDAGLLTLKDLPSLREIDLEPTDSGGTLVTPKGIDEFKKAMPDCEVKS